MALSVDKTCPDDGKNYWLFAQNPFEQIKEYILFRRDFQIGDFFDKEGKDADLVLSNWKKRTDLPNELKNCDYIIGLPNIDLTIDSSNKVTKSSNIGQCLYKGKLLNSSTLTQEYGIAIDKQFLISCTLEEAQNKGYENWIGSNHEVHRFTRASGTKAWTGTDLLSTNSKLVIGTAATPTSGNYIVHRVYSNFNGRGYDMANFQSGLYGYIEKGIVFDATSTKESIPAYRIGIENDIITPIRPVSIPSIMTSFLGIRVTDGYEPPEEPTPKRVLFRNPFKK